VNFAAIVVAPVTGPFAPAIQATEGRLHCIPPSKNASHSHAYRGWLSSDAASSKIVKWRLITDGLAVRNRLMLVRMLKSGKTIACQLSIFTGSGLRSGLLSDILLVPTHAA
jgi:hypothetical protein